MDCLHLIFIFAIVFMVSKSYCPSHIAMVTIAGFALLFAKNRVEGFSPCPSSSPNCSPSPSSPSSPRPSSPSSASPSSPSPSSPSSASPSSASPSSPSPSSPSPSPSPKTDILSLLKKYKVYVGIGGGVFLLLLILLMSGGGS